MIPIECPRCGREGNVPPDRLNAKLTCRGCQAVFHLDNSGRMVMGAPGGSGKENRRAVEYNRPKVEFNFNLGESLKNIPKPVMIGVPLVLAAVLGWLFMPAGAPRYEAAAASVIKGLILDNKSQVVSSATSATSEAAGKWFDLIRAQIQKQPVITEGNIKPALIGGDPTKNGEIVMFTVILPKNPANSPLSINLPMIRDGGAWRIDGAKLLAEAESSAPTVRKN